MQKKTAFEFIGQVNMLALITILLLLPLYLINGFFNINNYTFNNIYKAALAVLVTTQYSGRMRYAGVMKNHPKLIRVNICVLALFLIYLMC